MGRGRGITQLKDFGFTISMERYIEERLHRIEIQKGRATQEKELLNERELSSFRGGVASCRWVAREGRPDGSGESSTLAGTLPEPVVKDLKDLKPRLRCGVMARFPLRLMYSFVCNAIV